MEYLLGLATLPAVGGAGWALARAWQWLCEQPFLVSLTRRASSGDPGGRAETGALIATCRRAWMLPLPADVAVCLVAGSAKWGDQQRRDVRAAIYRTLREPVSQRTDDVETAPPDPAGR